MNKNLDLKLSQNPPAKLTTDEEKYKEFRDLMAYTNPASGDSNLGIEKIMDEVKYQVLKTNWKKQNVNKKQLFKEVSLFKYYPY